MTQQPPTHGNDSTPDWYYNSKAKQVLPHLKRIFGNASTRSCVFTVADYDESWKYLSSNVQSVSFISEPRLDTLLLEARSDCVHRLIVVEDICVEAVSPLVNIFDISPEMFENHLAGAQPPGRTEPSYTNEGPKDWCTRRLKRDFISTKWLRPYRLSLNFEPLTISDRLISYKDILRWKLQCNAWRMHINLQGNSGKWSHTDGRSSNLNGFSTIASEEKVTLWRGKRGAIDFTVLLLDPGLNGPWSQVKAPTATEGDTRPVDRRRPRGRRTFFTQDDSQQSSSASQNSSPRPDTGRSDGRHAVAHTGIGTGGTADNSVGLSHDIEALPNSQVIHPIRIDGTIETDSKPFGQSSAVTQSKSAAQAVSTSTIPNDILPVGPENSYLGSSTHQLGLVMRNLAIRAPCHHLTVKEAFHAGALQPGTSTKEDLSTWLQYYQSVDPNSQNHSNPTYAVQEIILQDVHDFLHVVNNYLDEIEGLTDDEFRLEQNLLTWRQTLQYLRKELRNLHSSLEDLSEYLCENSHDGKTSGSRMNSSEARSSTSKAISTTEERLRTTSNILTSSISVAEARRGISETESVNRLTELAFIYIPLSFAASFFGMQVKELNPETTSIGGFFGLAVGVTLASYCLRLMVRSENLTDRKSSFMNDVRAEFGLREDAPVKTRQVIRFIGRRLILSLGSGLPVIAVLSLASLAAMIATWANSSLEGGIKIALAIVYIVVGLAFAGVMCILAIPFQSWPSYLRYQTVRSH